MLKGILLQVLLLTAARLGVAQDQGWLPVTSEDLNYQMPSGTAGASAVQLYYANYIDTDQHWEFYYRRIKILSDAGREYANVTIELPSKLKLDELQARTIHPDGTVIPFRDAPFEKAILKGKNIKVLAQTFTLPEVTLGSIVEYKYKVRNNHYRPEWIVEHDLFTVRESFHLKYSGPYEMTPILSRGMTKQPTTNKGSVALELENIPAFHPEAQMPPEENYKLNVAFVANAKGFNSADFFWGFYLNAVGRWYAQFLDDHKQVDKEVHTLLAPIANANPEQQLRTLYARAQQIRNLSYERNRTEREQKQEALKENKNVDDVLRHGYGTREDINALFVAMARAARFRAGIVMVSNRSERFFRKEVPYFGQLDSTIAEVEAGGIRDFYDPGTKYCPYGFVRWMRTSTDAVKLGFGGGLFFTTPPALQNQAVINRQAHLSLAPDGSVHGDIFVIFLGGEALERRLSALETDEAGRKRALEDEVKTWLPRDASIKLTDVQGWEEENQPLRANFDIEIPGYASLAGKRLLLPTCFFPLRQKDTFSHSERKYPVYFPYAFSEIDNVTFKLPEGFSVETGESNNEAKLSFATYRKFTEVKDGEINSRRDFLFNAIFVEPKGYPELRDFFAKVKAADESQVILQPSPRADASKNLR